MAVLSNRLWSRTVGGHRHSLGFQRGHVGATHCGVTTLGDAYCWGFNSDGQLGDGSTTDRLTPVRVVR